MKCVFRCRLPFFPVPNGILPAAMWGRIARLNSDSVTRLQGALTAKSFVVFSQWTSPLLAQSSRAGRRVSRQLLGAKQTRAGRPFNIRPIISAKKAASEFRHRQPAG